MTNRRSFLNALAAFPALLFGRAASKVPTEYPITVESFEGVIARVRAINEPLCVYVGRRGPEEFVAAREVVTFRGNWRRIYRWDGGIESYAPNAYLSIVPTVA